MDHLEGFYAALQSEYTAVLATAAEGRVTMRTVSPAPYEGGVLLFTDAHSEKYRQLAASPRCCLAVGAYFAEAEAELLGSTLLPENEALRAAYSAKFPGAFDEGVTFGGRNADFVYLRPVRLTGWCFAGGVPTPDGIPNEPFALALQTPPLRARENACAAKEVRL